MRGEGKAGGGRRASAKGQASGRRGSGKDEKVRTPLVRGGSEAGLKKKKKK